MRYFPLSIDTRGKKILVIGGGAVALRKVKNLLPTEFTIYVIGAHFEEELLHLGEVYPDRVKLKGAFINRDFIFLGYDYVVIATNDSTLNDHLEETAKRQRIPYVRSDHRSDSTFLMNRVISKGDLVVSVSTGGENPRLATLIGDDVEKAIDRLNLDPDKIDLLHRIRKTMVKQGRKDTAEMMEKLYREEITRVKEVLEELDEDSDRNTGEQPGGRPDDDDQNGLGEDVPEPGSGTEDH